MNDLAYLILGLCVVIYCFIVLWILDDIRDDIHEIAKKLMAKK